MSMVEPELVVEVDVARDSGGRWRHAAHGHRARPDVAPPGEAPPFEQ
ncbi:ATP-dependent DNA ligase [Streptomyces cellulosae]